MITLTSLLKENKKYQIYCDLDGVLTDFNYQFSTISNDVKNPQKYESKFGTDAFWDLIEKYELLQITTTLKQ